MSNLAICTYNKDQEKCPSYQRERYGKGTSEKYQQVSTRDIMDRFFAQGFEQVGISANKTRTEGKRGYQKHVAILTRDDLKIDDNNQLQLLITNAHDGSSSLRFNIGVYRFVCANGLVVGDTFFDYRVKHIGNGFIDKVDQGIQESLRVMPLVAQTVRNMQQFDMSMEQVNEFLLRSAQKRLKHVDNVTAIDLKTVGYVRRKEDLEDNLYNVFNRAQESVIRGGIKYEKRHTKWNGLQGVSKLKTHTTKSVKSIQTNMQLNKELWDMANRLLAV